jgi:hypothetical protein
MKINNLLKILILSVLIFQQQLCSIELKNVGIGVGYIMLGSSGIFLWLQAITLYEEKFISFKQNKQVFIWGARWSFLGTIFCGPCSAINLWANCLPSFLYPFKYYEQDRGKISEIKQRASRMLCGQSTQIIKMLACTSMCYGCYRIFKSK